MISLRQHIEIFSLCSVFGFSYFFFSLKQAPDFSCIFGLFTSFFDGTHFYDMDNNKIRTEWRINCNYPGPDGFCSLKCENEYKYR